ncbi:bifunctional lysylphosphatidylglycerol flippase/synthetase MprF [Microbacterium sp. RD1]|uniref:bifunctional lysylphosphatidylglycerol flippase/synthetase MprF n=1 Tax=Microbacterium sp. RD1 TaxID=3457313 RepID=UPI003FA53AAC
MGDRPGPAQRATHFLRRIPATLALMLAVIAVGVAWQGLWTSFAHSPVYDTVAYGLPALEAGRWWTPLTGTFFVNEPWVYVFTLTGFWGMAYLEFRRGSRVALAYFAGGQLFAVLATSLLLWLCAMLPWPWAETQAAALDVGPSGGTMACIAAALALFVSPWRLRAWIVLIAFIFLAVLFWGALADLEHVMGVLLVLAIDRSLRPQRVSVREQRLIAFVTMVVLAAVQLVTLVVPTTGPFGVTVPYAAPWFDVTFDAVVVLIAANGMRRGRRWAWIVSVALSVLNVLIGVGLITLIAIAGITDVEATVDADLSVTLATSVLWAMLLVYLLLVRRAFRAHRGARISDGARATREEVKEEIRTHGGGTLSWMATWENNIYARVGGGIVAYQRRAGVALALADPLGPEEVRPAAVREFIARAEHAGLIPCFFSAGDATRAAVPADWRSIVVADDTIVDLPGLAFTGKSWAAVRTSLNRAEREGVQFRLTRLRDEPWGIQQQLRAISESWVGDKGLPEMGFTLGTLTEADDPEVRLALAVSPEGNVDGFLSWLPIYGEGRVRGWTLDLMRRRDGGFGPVMEFLIGSSAKAFAEEGAEILSLSGAPLTHEYPADAGVIADVTDWVAGMLEPVYGFASLHRFKEKFNPRYETMYLLYRDESDLTRIAAALTRAFLPTATLRQFAGAGLELVRGEH